jgi:hypothetical protein
MVTATRNKMAISTRSWLLAVMVNRVNTSLKRRGLARKDVIHIVFIVFILKIVVKRRWVTKETLSVWMTENKRTQIMVVYHTVMSTVGELTSKPTLWVLTVF